MPTLNCTSSSSYLTTNLTAEDLLITAEDYPASAEGVHQINCKYEGTNINFTVQVTLLPNLNASFTGYVVPRLDLTNSMQNSIIYTSPVALDPESNSFTMSFEYPFVEYISISENSNRSFTITLDPTKMTKINSGF